MSELSQEQRVEMHAEKRRLHGVGDASGAAAIKAALDENRYFMGLAVVPEPELTAPKKSAKKEAWVRYALEASNIDPEIVNSVSRADLIQMLKANGIIE